MPGKSYREGISLMDMFRMFPDESASEQWFESIVWPESRACPHCGSRHTKETPGRKPMPYWCKECRSYFSVRTGTALARTHVPYQKWAVAGLKDRASNQVRAQVVEHTDAAT